MNKSEFLNGDKVYKKLQKLKEKEEELKAFVEIWNKTMNKPKEEVKCCPFCKREYKNE